MSPDARSASPAVDKGGSANPFGNVFSQYAYYLDFLNIFLVVFLFFFLKCCSACLGCVGKSSRGPSLCRDYFWFLLLVFVCTVRRFFTVVMVQSGIGPGTFKTRLYQKLEKLSKTNCTIKDKLPLITLLFLIFCFSFYLSNACFKNAEDKFTSFF